MVLDFRNPNTLWSSILVETFRRLGLTAAAICPGSRSAPLTVAFAQHPHLEAIPILDERSAAFFALGMAKRLGKPVALVCTSGTAGANFYPAVIEARESRVPLLVLTADRPPELRHCHAGQAIDQVKLYGSYPNWQVELALPSTERERLRYLRQTAIQAWERSLFPTPGPVHLNLPFREPLAPIPQADTLSLQSQFKAGDFFASLLASPPPASPPSWSTLTLQPWRRWERGIVVAGVAHPRHPQVYCQAIANLSKTLQYPVLADALSPLRNFAALNPHSISSYDLILRHDSLAETLVPDVVIQVGELPTSKELRAWLEKIEPRRWVLDPSPDNFDPLHGKAIHWRVSLEGTSPLDGGSPLSDLSLTPYLKNWMDAQRKVTRSLNRVMEGVDFLLEGKVAWLLSQGLPAGTPIFVANSMPVRNLEFFWLPGDTQIIPYCNRGANGIDGNLSTALGMAHRHRSSVMLAGDLTLLHDTNGFLIADKFIGSLTIILINNRGGGIFEMLPISTFDPPFEDFFVTPQNVDFINLCETYGIEYYEIANWKQFQELINPLPEAGVRLLEVRTDRKADARWLKENLGKFALA